MLRNHYETLGVSPSASISEIRARYRSLAKSLHPDLNPNDLDGEERLKLVNLAYRILSDPKLRKAYDDSLGLGSALSRTASDREAVRVEIVRFPVVSTVFRSVGYDTERRLLDVEFQKGAIFRYFDVPSGIYSELLQSEVKGEYYQKKIAGVYRERAMRRR